MLGVASHDGSIPKYVVKRKKNSVSRSRIRVLRRHIEGSWSRWGLCHENVVVFGVRAEV